MKTLASPYRIAALFLISIFLFQVMQRFVSRAMHFDGLIYSSLARNLADGLGTPWQLHFSDTLFPVFHEHPPLMIWMQAGLFRVFGESYAIEKLYGLVLLLVLCAVVLGIWRALDLTSGFVAQAWFLSLMFLTGVLTWGHTNNMLDAQLGVFTAAAVLCLIYAAKSVEYSRQGLWIGAASGLIMLGLLTKGPVGLFPLAAPGLYWLAMPNRNLLKSATHIILSVVAVTALWQLLVLNSANAEYARIYLTNQVLGSLDGARGSTGSLAKHAQVMVSMIENLLFVVLVLSWTVVKRARAGELQKSARHGALFALLVGLSASLPILISPRLYNFYFTPSLPFFAISAAAVTAPTVSTWLEELSDKNRGRIGLGMAALCGIAVLSVAINIKNPGSHGKQVQQARLVSETVCQDGTACRVTVAICAGAWSDWNLHAYLQRDHKISMESYAAAKTKSDWLIWRTDCAGSAPSGYDSGRPLGDGATLLRRL